MIFKKTVVFVIFLLAVSFVSAQRIRRTNNFQNYKDHVHEFGYAINLSYLKYEGTFSPQLHLHYSQYLTNFFSIGVGYSAIFDKHYHNTFCLEGGFRVYNNVLFTLKPGIVMKRIRGNTMFFYSAGFQANYEIEINESIHVGPVVELDIVQDDVNYLLGFHMGLTF